MHVRAGVIADNMNFMEIVEKIPQPGLIQAEPVLPVNNVMETLRYWKEVLGFKNSWEWGDPVTFGAISWHGVQVQFTQDPQLAATSTGNSVWFRVREVEQLYALHQSLGAIVVSPLTLQPWGMGQYTVRDLNGYLLHFAAPMLVRNKPGETLPDTVRIILRPPTVVELNDLAASVGWTVTATPATYAVTLNSLVAGVVAEATTTSQVIGCALLTGSAGSMHYVRDVMIHPDWQGKHIGTALMQTLMRRADIVLPESTTVALITGEQVATFYKQFDFTPIFSMIRYTRKPGSSNK